MEEKARILKLLEDGKVNAEEAARLLEALGEGRESETRPGGRHGYHYEYHWSPGRMRHGRRGLGFVPGLIGESVSAAVEQALHGDAPQAGKRFQGKHAVYLRAVSGDVKVEGHDLDEVLISKAEGALWRAEVEDEAVSVKGLAGDVTVRVPRPASVEVSSVSGDVEIEHVSGQVQVKSVSGDIELESVEGAIAVASASGDVAGRDVRGEIDIALRSGDLHLAGAMLTQAGIRLECGDVDLELTDARDVTLHLETEDGEIECDLPGGANPTTGTPRVLDLVLGKGTGRLDVSVGTGDIRVRGPVPDKQGTGRRRESITREEA